MILKGSQRSCAAQLAAHLLNDCDNDHVMMRKVRGFVADDLHGSFKEAQAVASCARCRQYLFSLISIQSSDASNRGLRTKTSRPLVATRAKNRLVTVLRQ